eukprot:6174029-Pleurochrysis_carterae.AAC.7
MRTKLEASAVLGDDGSLLYGKRVYEIVVSVGSTTSPRALVDLDGCLCDAVLTEHPPDVRSDPRQVVCEKVTSFCQRTCTYA